MRTCFFTGQSSIILRQVWWNVILSMLGNIECILQWRQANKGAEITQKHGLEQSRNWKNKKWINQVKLLQQKEELDPCVSQANASSYRSDCISKVMRGFILYNVSISRDVKFASKLNYLWIIRWWNEINLDMISGLCITKI